MSHKSNRRQFIRNTTAAGAGFWIAGCSTMRSPTFKPPDQKLNLAMIGCGGQGGSNLAAIERREDVNVHALCDVDTKRCARAIEKHPDTKFYADYREMLDKEAKNLDAVIVATPDHTHAPAAVMAMKLGLHCYTEKPLTWCIQEARTMAHVAKKHGVATQMGNQGSASSGFRGGVEAIQAGLLGNVREAHIWTDRPIWPQAINRPTETPPVPDTLDWDLWLAAAPDRPYNPAYLPFNWRGWYDYGTGALGDMACHTMNLAYRSLKLGLPESVEAETGPMFDESYPAWARIVYQFPARGDLPPVKMTWSSGGMKPSEDILDGDEVPNAGSVIVGDEGKLFSPDDYGSRLVLYPKDKFENWKRPPRTLPRTPGHHTEWLNACRGLGDTYSNFQFAGRFTEAILLGVVAMRTGKRIEWDAKNMKAIGVPEADQFISRKYRKGYSL